MRKTEILLYTKENGDCPVKEFIKKLDPKTRAKTIGILELLEERSDELREPYSKCIRSGIFELRCKASTVNVRIMYFYGPKNTVVLTNGFIKNTQRTPREEIRLATERRNNYLKRTMIYDDFKRIKK